MRRLRSGSVCIQVHFDEPMYDRTEGTAYARARELVLRKARLGLQVSFRVLRGMGGLFPYYYVAWNKKRPAPKGGTQLKLF